MTLGQDMQTNSRILDDIAKVASGAVGAAFSARDEVRARIRAELERAFGRMELVTRDEYDAVHAMAAKARDEQERMTERVLALEARLAELEKAQSEKRPASTVRSTSTAKPAVGKSSNRKTSDSKPITAKKPATAKSVTAKKATRTKKSGTAATEITSQNADSADQK
jgi:BMFP domain-containing protein YqiC